MVFSPLMELSLTHSLVAAGSAHPMFSLLAVMLTAVVVVSLLLLRARQSLLVGYFICGILIANTGIIERLGGADATGDTHVAVQQMAEFGVMLLMFVLGLEFSINELRFLRRFALIGGSLQMGLCLVLVTAIAKFTGLSWPASIVLGVALAMSSTAVSLKTFQDLGLSGNPGARFALGVAIFQDIFIIAFLVLLPLLLNAGSYGDHGLGKELGLLLLRGGAFIILAWINARWVVPRLLGAVVRTRSRELFTLAVVGCCVGLAFVGSLLQLSLALGAFVAGLAVSESVYKHRILAEIMPIKDVFLTLFFVSVGLLIDVRIAMENWLTIAIISVVLLSAKAVIVTSIALFLGQANRPALLGGLSLCSAGEFSLLLLQKAGGADLWDPALQQSLIASAALSMALVPNLMQLSTPISKWLDARHWGRTRPASPSARKKKNKRNIEALLHQRMRKFTSHAIICGYGPVGRALNRALLDEGVPTIIVELNADTVQTLMEEGQQVLFADAAHEETWALAKVEEAALVAFTFPDASTAAASLHHVRERNHEVFVVARSRFVSDRARLERLGANLVLHDEGEAAHAMVESGRSVVGGSRAAADEND
jgi:CPA2 family monovalent cation:H+ antiporter-2